MSLNLGEYLSGAGKPEFLDSLNALPFPFSETGYLLSYYFGSYFPGPKFLFILYPAVVLRLQGLYLSNEANKPRSNDQNLFQRISLVHPYLVLF